jgi:hypothetical protein
MLKLIRLYFISKPLSICLSGLLLFQIIFPTVSLALTSGPSTPEVQSFEPIGTTQLVDPFSGDFNYNIPLMDVGGYPINLHYHAGIGMEQEASWVGLGWNINPGVINRNMRGIPDDFNGDEITYKNNFKPNNTYGVNFGELMEVESFGKTTLNNPRPSYTFYYNNYKGVGYKTYSPVSLGFYTSFNLEFSSSNGFSADIGRQTKKNKYVGVSYNSREGLSRFTYSRKIKALKTNESYSWTVPFQNNNYSPVARPNTVSASVNIGYVTGSTFMGVYSKISQFNLNINSEYLTKQEKNRNVNSFGYLNSHLAKESDIMDKQNSGSSGFDKFTQFLGMTTHSYDVYSVSGQGTGGQFRPHRNQFGLLWEAERKVLNGFQKVDATLEHGTGNLVTIGVDLETEFNWGSSGKIKSNTNDKEWLDAQVYNGDNSQLKEPVYFKDMNDMTFMEEEYYNKIKQEKAVKVSIEDFVSKFPSMPPQYYFDKQNASTTTIPSENLSLSANPLKLTKRQKRANTIQYLSKVEAQNYGSKTASVYTQISDEKFSKSDYDFSNTENHHLSEITTLGADGSRYVYALPAVNKNQVAATFSVQKENFTDPYNNENGLFKYEFITNGYNDASVDNKKGLSHFYQSTNLPKYAYAYHLTAILSADYADISGDGPSPDDFGSYTKFNYEKINNYKWRAPFINATLDKGLLSNPMDDKASYLYGEKEIFVLRSVETKTHFAVFICSNREDGLSPYIEHNLDNNNSVTNHTQFLYKLDAIKLYTRQQIEENEVNGQKHINPKVNAIPIKTVNFEYSYDLCSNVINNTQGPILKIDPNNPNNTIQDLHPLKDYNINSNDDYDRNKNHKKGKLTLHKVYFTYGNSTKGALNPYLFEYKNNVDYQFKATDRWGTYSPNQSADGGIPNNESSISEFPYTRQDDKALADKHASMWCLSNIYLPSGGQIKIEYESDDYAYVQDKKAMQMIRIKGFVNELIDPFSSVSNQLYDKSKVNRYIIFPIETGKLITDYVPDGNEFGSLYFNILVDLTPYDSKNKNAKEYVQGYCQIEGKGIYTTDNGITYGYIKVNSEKVEQKNVTPHYIHPISGSAFQFIKLNMPWLVYHGSDWYNSTTSTTEKIVGTILSRFPELVRTIVGYNFYLRELGYARNVDLSASHIRLNNPSSKKLGGGHRVKSIIINDNWNSMSGEESHSYGQVYDYTTTENGKVISSGVASYEPSIGGDENPHRQPQYRRIKQKLVQDNYLYDEYPIAEELYPGAAIGYSKVSVRSLKPSDLGLNEIITNHETGRTEFEFYTFKDFPTLTSATKLDKYIYRPFLLSFAGVNIEKAVASQGFAIELNDMHGKLKSEKIFNNKEELISSSTYLYKVKDVSTKPTLDNEVVLLRKDQSIGKGLLGVEIETVAEPIHNEIHTFKPKVKTQLDMYIIPIFTLSIPAIAPSLYPSAKYSLTSVKSVSTTKIIQKSGILEKVIVMKNGSTLSTENLAWDEETGMVLLTKTETQFKGEYDYSLNIPAYYAYQGMEGSYKNINANMTGAVNSDGEVDFPVKWLLTKGDELAVSKLENGVYVAKDKAWVLDDDQTILKATLIKTDGSIYPSGDYHFKVIRSGYRNLQGTSIASILTTENPINSNNTSFSINYNKIIDANAIEYNDEKQIYPYLGGIPIDGCSGEMTLTRQEFMGEGLPYFIDYGYKYTPNTTISSLIVSKYLPSNNTSYNPYALGLKGVYMPYKSYVFYNKENPERTTSVNLNSTTTPNFNQTDIKTDGYLTNFTPFWTNFNAKPYWEGKTIDEKNDLLTDKWTWTSLSQIIDQNGNGVQSLNPLGIQSAVQFGHNKKFPLAVANNASHSSILFDGFEEYDKGDLYDCNSNLKTSILINYLMQQWHWYLWPNLTKDRANISVSESHTGKQSLQILKGYVEVPFSLITEPSYTTRQLMNQFYLKSKHVIHPFYPNSTNEPKEYLLTYWSKFDPLNGEPTLRLQYKDASNVWNSVSSNYIGEEIWVDGWRKLTISIIVPSQAKDKEMRMLIHKTIKSNGVVKQSPTQSEYNDFKLFIDDIKVMPVNASMVSYVYDNLNYRIMAVLNDNHFATFYEYDDEGNLIRTKQETEKGIKTIKENRQNINKK